MATISLGETDRLLEPASASADEHRAKASEPHGKYDTCSRRCSAGLRHRGAVPKGLFSFKGLIRKRQTDGCVLDRSDRGAKRGICFPHYKRLPATSTPPRPKPAANSLVHRLYIAAKGCAPRPFTEPHQSIHRWSGVPTTAIPPTAQGHCAPTLRLSSPALVGNNH